MNTFTKQPNIQRVALQKALQSPRIGKHGKRKETLALEKALDKKAENIIEEMLAERSRIMGFIGKKRSNATYRDLIHGLDVLNKNIQLLSGKNTNIEETVFSWKD